MGRGLREESRKESAGRGDSGGGPDIIKEEYIHRAICPVLFINKFTEGRSSVFSCAERWTLRLGHLKMWVPLFSLEHEAEKSGTVFPSRQREAFARNHSQNKR